MCHVEITLRSGAMVTFEADDFEWTQQRARITGEVTGRSLKWTTPEGAQRRGIYVDVEEIAAVVFVEA